MPVYIMGRFGAHLVHDEEETQAQNKVAFGLVSLFLIYPAAFFFLWALFWYTPFGAILAATTVYMFAIYHNRMINANYEVARRFIAAWRVLIGIWAPKKWDLSLTALSPYTTPSIPKENPWIDKPKSANTTTAASPSISTSNLPQLLPDPNLVLPGEQEPPVNPRSRSRRRPPTRRIMRHVLRARVEAVKALATFFDQLEGAASTERGKKLIKVRASRDLAQLYGGLNGTRTAGAGVGTSSNGVVDDSQEWGWRYATEVVAFLRRRGAKIPSASGGSIGDDEWTLTSDAEADSDKLEPISS